MVEEEYNDASSNASDASADNDSSNDGNDIHNEHIPNTNITKAEIIREQTTIINVSLTSITMFHKQTHKQT